MTKLWRRRACAAVDLEVATDNPLMTLGRLRLGCESFVLWHLKKDAQVLRSICTALAAHPARPGARRSTALRGCGRCWTCVSGWGRVAPQGCPGAMASGRATWQGRREKQELARLQRLVDQPSQMEMSAPRGVQLLHEAQRNQAAVSTAIAKHFSDGDDGRTH
jgi:hypothetical protein